MIPCKKSLFLLFAFILIPSLALADFSARVVKVKDGDTIVVLYDNRLPVNLRLLRIDAPELGQRFGKEAKRYASGLLYNKTVTVRESGMDKYYRLLGEVTLPDGRDFSEEMLRAGYAWHYVQYDQSQKLGDIESEARDAQRGLWADLDPTPPWAFRRKENKENFDDDPIQPRYRVRGARRGAGGFIGN